MRSGHVIGVVASQPARNRFRRAFYDAWHGATVREILWTLAIGFCFIVSHAYSISSAAGRPWPIPIRMYEWFFAPQCLILLIAFRFAEHPLLASLGAWKCYAWTLAVAIPLFFALETALVAATDEEHSFRSLWAAYIWSVTHILVIFIVGAAMYSNLARSRRSQAALDAAAMQRALARRRVTTARLAAMQAQVDPTFLFSTLELIERLYASDPLAAEASLGNLIDFLRTALPHLGEHGSTIAREVHLARAYLEIVRARRGGRLEVLIDVPHDLEPAAFPAMIIVPIVERGVQTGLEPRFHGGGVEICARRTGDRVQVSVLHTGTDGDVDPSWLESLRMRLTDVYGDAASLDATHVAGHAGVVVAVPYEVVLPARSHGLES